MRTNGHSLYIRAATIVVAAAVFCVTSSWGAAAPTQRQAVEKQLHELDRRRGEAEAFHGLTQQLIAVVLQRIRVDPYGSEESKAQVREAQINYCEKEASWRQDFQQIETSLKNTNGGSLPTWVTQNRSWQKLDVAMKKDTVNVKPSECREIHERYIK